MLSCCAKNFTASYRFAVFPKEGELFKKIEFSYCPHCDNAVYKEIITLPNGEINETPQQKGIKAEEEFAKAKFNRLNFLERLKQGSKANQNWFYGDCKKSNKKDERGNPVWLQLKRNFNGEAKVLGEAPVVYA